MTANIVMLAIMLLLNPESKIDTEMLTKISAEAELGYEVSRDRIENREKVARISSCRSDFDREAGVAMFEGNVRVVYDKDYIMVSDRLFVFAAGTNRLNRIVAMGNVSITNETRVGTCAMAEFRRLTNEIEMFGNAEGVKARLADTGTSGDALMGSRIKFWLDSEQVEVDRAEVSVENKGENEKEKVL